MTEKDPHRPAGVPLALSLLAAVVLLGLALPWAEPAEASTECNDPSGWCIGGCTRSETCDYAAQGTDKDWGCSYYGPAGEQCYSENPCPQSPGCFNCCFPKSENWCWFQPSTLTVVCYYYSDPDNPSQQPTECKTSAGPAVPGIVNMPSCISCGPFPWLGASGAPAVGTLCASPCGPTAPLPACGPTCDPSSYGVHIFTTSLQTTCAGMVPSAVMRCDLAGHGQSWTNPTGSPPGTSWYPQFGIVIKWPNGTETALCIGPDPNCTGIGIQTTSSVGSSTGTHCIQPPVPCQPSPLITVYGIQGVQCVGLCLNPQPTSGVPACYGCNPYDAIGVVLVGAVTLAHCERVPDPQDCPSSGFPAQDGIVLDYPMAVPVCVGIDPACTLPTVGLIVNNVHTGCQGPGTTCDLPTPGPGPGWEVGYESNCVGLPWIEWYDGTTPNPYCPTGGLVTVVVLWGSTPGAPGPYTAFCL